MRIGKVLVAALLAFVAVATPMSAQSTSGTVAGTVKDSQGGVIPGATVTLISETQGTRSQPATTNEVGDYVFPNVPPDTYTVEVTMPGFSTLKRDKVNVSSGARVAIPALVINPGGTQETIMVTGDAPLIQAQSGERSYAITASQIDNLPMSGTRSFTALAGLAPGVVGTTRLGGGGGNNVMMDGVSAIDTGTGGGATMLPMNIESIGEVKVISQGYQAEFGRSSGLQITAVTKSGSNQFHGSGYDIEDNSDWASNSWAASRNGQAKAVSKTHTFGYSIGGPVGRPGGTNKLFFFYAHEYRPTTTGGTITNFRVPTALERAGDFSQTRDNNGNLFNLIKDPLSTAACTAANTAGCFIDGGTLGKIPQNRLYQLGLNILNRYPLPNVEQTAGIGYNYKIATPDDKNLLQQPVMRVDWQASPRLRISGRYSGQRERQRVIPGTMSPYNDYTYPYPFRTGYGTTIDYALGPTMVLEGTYGKIYDEVVGNGGGGSPGFMMNPDATIEKGALAGFPLIYPDAGKFTGIMEEYYSFRALNDLKPPFWNPATKTLYNVPNFAWGSRVANQPPFQGYAGYLVLQRTQDFAISLTKIAGHHTMKTGFYNNHSFKTQNTGAGGVANQLPYGYIDFGNNTSNPLDSGFGYANAALGVYTQYMQQNKYVEGNNIYNNTEGFIQDNWKVSSRLTLDMGIRLTRQQPQYDKFKQASNFFPNEWKIGSAPILYVPGCSNGAATCSGATLNAMDPRTGQFVLTSVGNTSALVGTIVPNSGNLTNGIHQAGDGISNYNYNWPSLVYGPRVGMAYDVTGTQKLVVRGGYGVFFDRPDGNTVYSSVQNPPYTQSTDLRNGQLQTVGTGQSPIGVSSMSIFQYNAQVPWADQWNAGFQATLPWSSSIDVSYVGQHSHKRQEPVDLNAIDLGAAYLAKNQDLTKAATTVPGNNAVVPTLMRGYRGLNNIRQRTTYFSDMYQSLQTSFNRRFTNGLSFGVNYTLSLSFDGTTGLTQRLDHAADGTMTIRADQAQYEDLNSQLNLQRHVLRANAVWAIPSVKGDTGAMKVLEAVTRDWQLSSILSAGSGARYDLGYSYQSDGSATNLTGSPDYAAKLILSNDLGSKGCSSNQYQQFNVKAVSGPTYGSSGLESGRNYLIGCADHTVDLSISRRIKLGGSREATFRVDGFNVLNTVVINARNSTVQFTTPSNQTIRNSQTLADGSIDPARLTPQNAGFGAATGAQAMRTVRITFRLGF